MRPLTLAKFLGRQSVSLAEGGAKMTLRRKSQFCGYVADGEFGVGEKARRLVHPQVVEIVKNRHRKHLFEYLFERTLVGADIGGEFVKGGRIFEIFVQDVPRLKNLATHGITVGQWQFELFVIIIDKTFNNQTLNIIRIY